MRKTGKWSLIAAVIMSFAFGSVHARWLSSDPVQANPNNGQNFNRYNYANNNPYRFTDPDGRQSREFNWENQNIHKVTPPPRAEGDWMGPAIGVALGAVVAVPIVAEVGAAALANPGTANAIATTVLEAGAGDALGGATLAVAATSAVNALNLGKQLASEAQLGEVMAGQARVIVGGETGSQLRAASGLADTYGGQASDWTKVTSSSHTAADGQQFSTHAYQNHATGQVVEPKVKFEDRP